MENCARRDGEEALAAIAEMIARSEKGEFAPGTSQHTLQRNRVRALRIASALLSRELGDEGAPESPREELEKARAPLLSLISKSEKAREKLTEGTWQHAMLEKNLRALHRVLPLLGAALEE